VGMFFALASALSSLMVRAISLNSFPLGWSTAQIFHLWDGSHYGRQQQRRRYRTRIALRLRCSTMRLRGGALGGLTARGSNFARANFVAHPRRAASRARGTRLVLLKQRQVARELNEARPLGIG
jgi:hypothetical protein